MYPNNGWKDDKEFQSNCLMYTLFHTQNYISGKKEVNNWIPFTEKEVEPKNNFESHFMNEYIKDNNIIFTQEAVGVLKAGLELYKYYHGKEDSNPNASFYDIRLYFQKTNKDGKMNSRSEDFRYMELLKKLKDTQRILAKSIELKIYKYEFLIK